MSAAEGVLELGGNGGGHLRRRQAGYVPQSSDVRVSDGLIRRLGLRPGDDISGETQSGRGGNSLDRVTTVNGLPADAVRERPDFARLTAIHPNELLRLEPPTPSSDYTNRVIDLLSPLGKGQRALIVAPAKAGKTMVLQAIAGGVRANYPDADLFILLVDERPEEVFEMEAAGVGEVIASSFDNPASQHVGLAELLLERARRRVEQGKDVVLVVDSLTRLARAYNATGKGSGRTLSGGLDSEAMERPKRFFGSARKVDPSKGGGSLTIIATALIETGSKMDDLIFEEFKGTGNSELVLSRELSDRRIFPAVNLVASGTRKEELLLSPEALDAAHKLRQRIARMPPLNAMNDLLVDLRRYPTNAALIASLKSS